MATNPLIQSLIGAEGLIAPQKPKDLFASLLIKNALSTEPVGHWTQGAARMAQALLGGLELRGREEDEKSRSGAPDEIANTASRFGMGGGSAPPPMRRTPSVAPTGFAPQAPPAGMAPPASPPPATFADRFNAISAPREGGEMTVSQRQVQTVNAPPPITWGDGMVGQPNELPPPGPVMAQSGQAPVSPGPSVSSGPAGPDMMGAAREMQKSKNPYVRAYGNQLMLQEIGRSPEYEIKTEGGITIAVDKRNPRNRHIIDDPNVAHALIQRRAQEQYATTSATERAKKDVVKPERDAQAARSGNIVVQDIDRALSGLTKPGLPSSGPVAAATRYVPGTNAFNADKLIDTIKANAGFDKLQQMREASPTGGALGAVTERELALLQAAIGNLDVGQDREQLSDNLRRVKNLYLDIIHGPGNGPREKLKFEDSAQPAQPQQQRGGSVPWQTYFGGR